jgi:hypothetical protein
MRFMNRNTAQSQHYQRPLPGSCAWPLSLQAYVVPGLTSSYDEFHEPWPVNWNHDMIYTQEVIASLNDNKPTK